MDYLDLWWNEKSPTDPTKTLAEQARDQFLDTVYSCTSYINAFDLMGSLLD